MCAVGKRLGVGNEHLLVGQWLVPDQIEDRNLGPGRSCHREQTVLVDDVLQGRLESLCGPTPSLVEDPLGGAEGGRSADLG